MTDINITYKNTSIASVSESGQTTLQTAGKYCEDNITIDYVKPSAPAPTLQSKEVDPSTSAVVVTADSGYDGLDEVTVNAMPEGTAGTPVATKGTVSNHAISVTPSVTNTTGYILGGTKTGSAVSVSASELVSGTLAITSAGTKDVTNYASASVASGSASTPATTITTNPSISVNASGLITASVSGSKSVTPSVSAGYVASGTSGTITVSGSNTSQLSTQAAATITPTESEQTAVAAGKYTTGIVKVGAISSSYVGSGIDRRDETDLSVSGATVTVPAGYYEEQETATVASGSAGTPTATKGTVSNHSIAVTPSVTNTTGYITGGTKTGTAVTVSASELVSGTYNVSSVGTTDITYYKYISVPSGEATATAEKGTVSNHSISITPSATISEGYMEDEIATGTAVTVSASELVSGDLSITSSGTKDVINYATATVASGTEGTPVATKTTSSTTTNYLPPMVDGTYSGNGVTAVVSNGVATFSGTTNTTGNAFIIPLQSSMIIPDDSYLHCMNSVLNTSLTPSFELSSDVSNTYFAPSLSPANRIYTIPTNRYGVTIDRIRFYISNGVTISGTFSPMICLTSSAIPYEPYGATNTIIVTPSVTNTAGYIAGGTKTGEAVTVTASELVYGTKEITSAGTTDVTNYASASVASGVEGTPVATKSIISASKNLSPVSSLAAMDLWGSDLNTASRMGATLKTLAKGTYTISWKYTLTALDSGTFQYGSYIRWYDGSNWHILASYSLTTASNPSIGDTFNVARTITIDDDAYGKDINVLAYCGQGGGSAWRASVDEYQIESGSQQTAFEPYRVSNAMSVTPSVTNESGYINGSTVVGNPVTVFVSELVTVYNGEHHQPVPSGYTVTVSLMNPVHPSNFTSCAISNYTTGEVIGTITSPTGSIELAIPASITQIAIAQIGMSPYYDSSNISCTGGVSYFGDTGLGTDLFLVNDNGTITYDGVDYDG